MSPGRRSALRPGPENVDGEPAIEVLIPGGPDLGYTLRWINEIPAHLSTEDYRTFVINHLAKADNSRSVAASLDRPRRR